MVAADPGIVRRTGSLRIATSDDERLDIDRERRARERDGFRVEAYEGPEGSGLLLPDDACMNPLDRCRAVARRLVEDGVSLFARTRVRRIDGTLVQTDRGDRSGGPGHRRHRCGHRDGSA